MPKWDLMRLEGKGAKQHLRPLTKGEQSNVPLYQRLLKKAARSQCTNPLFSDYHVKGCIGNKRVTAPSGNMEYGGSQALHLEVAAGAVWASLQNSREISASPTIAIVAGHGQGSLKSLVTPCGDCRDFLIDAFGHECVIVCGTLDRGVAMVAMLKDLLFEDYLRVPLRKLGVDRAKINDVIYEGGALADNILYDPTKCPLRNYFVGISTRCVGVGRRMYFGATTNWEDCHPTYPLEDAVRQMVRARDPYIQSVIIVAEGDGSMPPSVMYRDRQRLFGAVVRRELLDDGKLYDPPVLLATYRNGKLTGAWRTSAKQWLPLPFSVLSFGTEFRKDHTAELQERYCVD